MISSNLTSEVVSTFSADIHTYATLMSIFYFIIVWYAQYKSLVEEGPHKTKKVVTHCFVELYASGGIFFFNVNVVETFAS